MARAGDLRNQGEKVDRLEPVTEMEDVKIDPGIVVAEAGIGQVLEAIE